MRGKEEVREQRQERGMGGIERRSEGVKEGNERGGRGGGRGETVNRLLNELIGSEHLPPY